MTRLASGTSFPHGMKTICYIMIEEGGGLQSIVYGEAKRLANAGVKIYAVWPGQWRSDLFLCDDLIEDAW